MTTRTLVQNARLALRRRPAAVQHRHGHDRRRRAVHLRRARDLPRRAQLRGRVRRLLRRDGAGSLHRPDPRRAAAGRWSRCSRTRSPRVWVSLLFVGLQQLEGHVVAPQIFGHTLRINPLLVIFALLLGLQRRRHRRRARSRCRSSRCCARRSSTCSRHLTLEPWDRSREGCCRTRVSARERRRVLQRAGLASASASARRCATSASSCAPASSSRVVGPNGAGKTTLLSILAGVQRRAAAASSTASPPGRRPRDRLGAAAAGRLLEADGRARTCACSRASSASPTSTPRSRACSSRPASPSAPTIASSASPAATASASTSRSALIADPRVLALDEPSSALDPASARACGSSSCAPSSVRRRGTRRVGCSRPTIVCRGASATPPRSSLVLGGRRECSSMRHAGRAVAARRASRPAAISSARSCASWRPSGRVPGWALRACAARQGPADPAAARGCSLALLIIYPVAIALLIGLAISRSAGAAAGGDRQRDAARADGARSAASACEVDASMRSRCFTQVQPVPRRHARAGGREGRVGRSASRRS